MTLPSYRIVAPDYLARFHCDGESCGASCCRGWLIRVDRRAYERYRKLRDGAFVRKAARYLRRFEDEESGGYAYIRLTESARCPFLCPDKLCYIQRRWGESLLSETCRKYPRYLREIDGAYEYALNLSCPLAAKLALLPDAPVAWVEKSVQTLPCAPDSTLNTAALRADFPMVAHFQPIRTFTLRLLAQENLRPALRLAQLDALAQRLDALARSGAESEAPACLAALCKPPSAETASADFPAYLRQQRSVLSAICAAGDASFLAPFTEQLSGSERVLRDRCRENARPYAAFCERRAHLWGNFLASEAFRAGLPFYGAGATFTQRCRLFAALCFSFPHFLFLLNFPAASDDARNERFAQLASALLRATASDALLCDLTARLADAPPLLEPAFAT